MSDRIRALMAFLEKLDINPGDKVALLSTNMPHWGISYFAVSFMGAIIVPLLPDFASTEIENILKHSEAKAIIVSDSLAPKINEAGTDNTIKLISIEDFSMIEMKSDDPIYEFEAKPQKEYDVYEEDLAAIIYTSGTTGNSKGVMLTHKNICINAIAGGKVQSIDQNDRFLSILPLSHTYENTLGLILPMIKGACIYYLKQKPVASVLLPALQQVKPTIMLSVPLIIERIYFNKVLPTFTDKWLLKTLYATPGIRKLLNRAAGKKLIKTFGGEIKFFGIGGAKLNKTVEKFLIEAKFPYAIGYGLTETSPLLAGVNPQNTRLESTGPAVAGVELKIHKPDMNTGEGEIWAKGPNVMRGYYKDLEQTAKVLTPDGWFKTGDLGILDKDNFLFIKGRSKSVIVGASGENVYPEEIESVINNFRHVLESVVVQQKGKLVALVHFNREEIEERYKHLRSEVSDFAETKISELQKELINYVNTRVNRFSRIHMVVNQSDPFEKTATQKIKRFLYT